MNERNIKDLSLIELKALAFDLKSDLEERQQKYNIVLSLIFEKTKKENEERENGPTA